MWARFCKPATTKMVLILEKFECFYSNSLDYAVPRKKCVSSFTVIEELEPDPEDGSSLTCNLPEDFVSYL